MNRKLNKLLSVFLLVAIVTTMFSSISFAKGNEHKEHKEHKENIKENIKEKVKEKVKEVDTSINVTVRIQGNNIGRNNGTFANEYVVKLNEKTGLTAFDALKKVSNDKHFKLTTTGSAIDVSVTSIGGQVNGKITPESGWKFQVLRQDGTDEIPTVGCGAFKLQNGDKMTWYYAIPEQTAYSFISSISTTESAIAANVKLDKKVGHDKAKGRLKNNAGVIYYNNSTGSAITVNIKAKKYIGGQLSSAENLTGAAIVLVDAKNGRELAYVTTDGNGNATIIAPKLNKDTVCYLYVKNKFYKKGEFNTGLQQVQSWKETVIIKRK